MFLGYDTTCVETVFSSDTQYRFQTIKRLKNKKFWRCPMANIKSAKKRVALSKAAYEKNKADKSALKTAVKKFEAAVASGNREQADSAYKAAVKSVDQGVKKGILHKNNAARKKSSMTLKLNKLA